MITADQNKAMLKDQALFNAHRSFNAWNVRTAKAERPQSVINNAAKSECAFTRKQFRSECNALEIALIYDTELIRLGMPPEIVRYAEERSKAWQ